MLEDKKKVLVIGAICVIIVIGGFLYYFLQNVGEEQYIDFENLETNVEDIKQNEIIVEEKAKILVHISGSVVNPGVISLEEGSRIIDAINNAGGLTSEADITKINLAYILEDAQKIYIPSKKDEENVSYIIQGSGETGIINDSGKLEGKKEEKLMVNINMANKEELEKLPGIGSSIATRIVEYRKENGKFGTIEDIKNVSGIGEAKFNNIKNYICVK